MPQPDFLLYLPRIYVCFNLGAFAISDHTITYGVLTSMLALVSQIQGPVRGISSILPSYYSALASAERLMDIENLDNEDVVNNSAIDTEKAV